MRLVRINCVKFIFQNVAEAQPGAEIKAILPAKGKTYFIEGSTMLINKTQPAFEGSKKVHSGAEQVM